MVSAAELDIDIDVDVGSSIGKLESLSESLRDVAAAQRLVDENMTIDIDVDDDSLSSLEERLGLQQVGTGFQPADGGDFLGFDEVARRLRNEIQGEANDFGDDIDKGDGVLPDGGQFIEGLDRSLAENIDLENRPDLIAATGVRNRADFAVDDEGVGVSGLPVVRDEDFLPQVATESTGPMELRTRDVEVDPTVGVDIRNFGGADFGFGDEDFLNFDRSLRETVDEVGDTFETVTDNMEVLNISMTAVNNLFADFVPLLVTLVGALPALIAGVVSLVALGAGLAGGLAALTGLGLFGIADMRRGPMSDNLTAIFEDIQQQFTESFAPIARALAPTVLDGIEDFEQFIDTLGQSSTALLALRDDFDALLDFAFPRTATFLRRMALAGDAAAPVFGRIADFLNQTNFARAFVGVLADTLPLLTLITGALIDFIGPLIQFSIGLGGAIIALFTLVDIIQTIITLGGVLPISAKALGLLIGGLLIFTTLVSFASSVVSALSFILNSGFLTAVGNAIVGVIGLESTILQFAVAAIGAAVLIAGALALVTAGLSAITTAVGAGLAVAGGNTKLDSFGGGEGSGRRGGITYNDVTTYNIDTDSVEKGKRIGRKQSYREGTRTDDFVIPR